MKYKFYLLLDPIGLTASSVCAIHCAVLPVLVTALPLWGLSFLATPHVEQVMLSASFVVATTSLVPSCLKRHKQGGPLLLMLTGFVLIILGHIVHPIEMIVVPLGGITIAAAHYKNRKLCSACKANG